MSLSTKYRPQDFDDVIGQEAVVQILKRQLETGTFVHSYLLCGASGCGKTTLARIFAKKLNGNYDGIIDIDAASNNGVENVRNIIKSAQERSVSSKYKVFIIDECHSITIQGWQAFLKCIEEPPAYTIFIFCTTDPQKVPVTIQNRCQKHVITKLGLKQIKDRLRFICREEHLKVDDSTLQYIARLSNGSLRQSITYLEQSLGIDGNLSIENVIRATGGSVYDTYFKLANSIIDQNVKAVTTLLNDELDKGVDVKVFVDQFFAFCLDLVKYSLFKDFGVTSIPETYYEQLNSSTNFEYADKYYMYMVDKILDVKSGLKSETSPREFVDASFMRICSWK